MPIEIRELVIKTEVSTGNKNHVGNVSDSDLKNLKKQVLEECKRMLVENEKRNSHKR
jgi:hypothetical protein